MPNDSGTMYSTAAMLAAIWWLASATSPRRAMNKAISVKDVTSTITDKPAGTPSVKKRRSCTKSGGSGQRQSR